MSLLPHPISFLHGVAIGFYMLQARNCSFFFAILRCSSALLSVGFFLLVFYMLIFLFLVLKLDITKEFADVCVWGVHCVYVCLSTWFS
jgi:hypothetical protein